MRNPTSYLPTRRFRSLTAFIVMSALIGLTACLRPVEGDFPDRGQGLADDELLCVLRIPAKPVDAGIKSVSLRDSIKFENYNRPLFANGIQQLVKRILNGEIKAFDEYPGQTELKNPRERLIQLGGTGQNIDPLLHVAELYVTVNVSKPLYNGKPAFLRLIWRDPEGQGVDRSFAGIRLDMEGSGSFLLGESFQREFAKIESYYAMPIYLRTNFREYGIRSIEEARYVQKMLYSGGWNQITWEEDGINISGKERVSLDPESVLPLAGFYRFLVSSDADSMKYAELYLTAENDYLVADWSNRFRVEKILPYGYMQFFSNSGELYWFQEMEDSSLALFVIQGNDTLGSYQYPAE